MSDCCAPRDTTVNPPGKYRCPVNGREYHGVSSTTILHHLKNPWEYRLKEQDYYFCEDPECNVVYFGRDNSVIEKSILRTPVGIKEPSNNALVCYCFGITVHDATTNPEAKAFVIRKTAEHRCACESRNPSGRCCLKDFPKI